MSKLSHATIDAVIAITRISLIVFQPEHSVETATILGCERR
jgi:hypothetical protein